MSVAVTPSQFLKFQKLTVFWTPRGPENKEPQRNVAQLFSNRKERAAPEQNMNVGLETFVTC